jgi:hypothetical protein
MSMVASFPSDSIMYEGIGLAFNQHHHTINITIKATPNILPRSEKSIIQKLISKLIAGCMYRISKIAKAITKYYWVTSINLNDYM